MPDREGVQAVKGGPSDAAVYCASEAAIVAAAMAYPGNNAGLLADALIAAHDRALGLDRSVCLRDVVEWMRQPWTRDVQTRKVVAAMAREFGNEGGRDAAPDNNGRCRVCGEWRGPDGCCKVQPEPSPDALREFVEELAAEDEATASKYVAVGAILRAREAPLDAMLTEYGLRREATDAERIWFRPGAGLTPEIDEYGTTSEAVLRVLEESRMEAAMAWDAHSKAMARLESRSDRTSDEATPAEPVYEWRAVTKGGWGGPIGPRTEVEAWRRYRDNYPCLERRTPGTAPGPWERVDEEGRRDG